MVVFDRTFVQRHLLDAFFAEHGITYQVALQSNFVSLVVQAALDNMGVATLLRSVQQRTPGIVGVPFRPAQQMSFRLCWRSGNTCRWPASGSSTLLHRRITWSGEGQSSGRDEQSPAPRHAPGSL